MDRVLFDPDNRLLGSSTGDFSYYGGQTDPSLNFRDTAPANDGADARPDAPTGHGPVAGGAAQTGPAGHIEDSASSMLVPAAFSGGSASFFQPHFAPDANAPEPSVSTAPYAPQVYASQFIASPHAAQGAVDSQPAHSALTPTDLLPGNGIDPALTDTLVGDTVHGVANVAAAALGGVGHVVTDLADLTGTLVVTSLDGLGDTLQPVAAGVSTLVDGVAATSQGVLEGVSEATGSLVEAALDGVAATVDAATPAIDPQVEAATDTLGDVAQAAGSLVGATLDGVSDAAGGVTTAVAGLAGTALDGLAAAPQAIAETVSPLVETASDLASATVSVADDALDGLAGSDPAAGVATLVSLVSISDMFDLHSVDASDGADAGMGDLGFPILDALADEDAASLLGSDHDDHGLADHAGHSDHPLGL